MSFPRYADTYIRSSSRYRALFAERVPRELADGWLANPRGILAEATGARAGSIFVKHHRRRLHKVLGDCLSFRKTPALRAFETGRALEKNRVDAARPLAVIERLIPGESFLILEHAEGLTLHDYITSTLPGAESGVECDRLKAELWSALAAAAARLHAARVRQRDLKAPNILIDTSGDAPRAVLVDLEGMQRLSSLPNLRQRARDLARLAVSLRTPAVREAGVEPRDCEEVVRLYLDACRATFPEERDLHWWAEMILSWAEKKEERNRRRGRPIY